MKQIIKSRLYVFAKFSCIVLITNNIIAEKQMGKLTLTLLNNTSMSLTYQYIISLTNSKGDTQIKSSNQLQFIQNTASTALITLLQPSSKTHVYSELDAYIINTGPQVAHITYRYIGKSDQDDVLFTGKKIDNINDSELKQKILNYTNCKTLQEPTLLIISAPTVTLHVENSGSNKIINAEAKCTLSKVKQDIKEDPILYKNMNSRIVGCFIL